MSRALAKLKDTCLHCGYDLKATAPFEPIQRRCPECGTIDSHIERNTRIHVATQRVYPRKILIAVLVFSHAFGAAVSWMQTHKESLRSAQHLSAHQSPVPDTLAHALHVVAFTTGAGGILCTLAALVSPPLVHAARLRNTPVALRGVALRHALLDCVLASFMAIAIAGFGVIVSVFFVVVLSHVLPW